MKRSTLSRTYICSNGWHGTTTFCYHFVVLYYLCVKSTKAPFIQLFHGLLRFNLQFTYYWTNRYSLQPITLIYSYLNFGKMWTKKKRSRKTFYFNYWSNENTMRNIINDLIHIREKKMTKHVNTISHTSSKHHHHHHHHHRNKLAIGGKSGGQVLRVERNVYIHIYTQKVPRKLFASIKLFLPLQKLH